METLSRLPDLVRFCGAPTNAQARSRAYQILNQQILADSRVRGTGVIDRSGRVILATEPPLTGLDLSYHPYVREGMLGRAAISDVHFAESVLGNPPTVAYLAPIQGSDGKLCGLAALWLRAEAVWSIARTSNELAGKGSFGVLFDRDGVRIAHTFNQDIVFHPAGRLDSLTINALVAEGRFGEHTRELLTDVRSFPEQFERARAARLDPGTFRGFAPVNQKWNYGVGRRLSSVSWTAFYMIPEESLLAQIADATRSKTLMIGGMMAIVMLGGALFAATIVAPIGALTGATESLAKGDFSARVSAARTDEIGRLGAGFNAMAERIETQSIALETAREEMERRVAERTADLARLETRFRAVVESAPSGMVMVGQDGKIVLVNREIERLFGYGREELLGQPVELLVPRAVQERHPGLRTGFMANPETRAMGSGRDLFGRRKDGQEIPVEIGLNPIETEDGVFVLASVIDLSARKRAEARFRTVVESAPSGMMMVGRDGKIVLVNREIERLFGYDRQELLGQPVELLVPRSLQGRHPGLRSGFMAKPETRAMGSGRDLFGRRKDGHEIPVEIGLNPIETEDGLFVLASVVDLSARKRAEARFRTVVESAPSGMVMIGRDGKIVLVNQEIERLFGYDREELLGQGIEMLVPLGVRESHPGLRTDFFARPEARVMGAGRDLFGRRKDGMEIPVEIGLNPIESEEGLFVLASVVDISARKKSEEELRRSNEELERFAYVASHDLQEPLRTVTSYVQLLARRYRDRLDQDGLEFIDFAVDGSKRMQRLIEDLLAFSRLGTRGAALVETDIAAVVDRAFESVRATANDTHATLTRDSLPVVMSDPAQIEQVFTNLISNALKFHGDRAPVIHVSATRAGAFWAFRVRDNGIGIEPEYFERIFIIFQRLHTRQEYPGTGIGLAICKKIIERHGGRIGVESSPDQGTTFVLTLRALS